MRMTHFLALELTAPTLHDVSRECGFSPFSDGE